MTARIKILDRSKAIAHDSPPTFSSEERKKNFKLTDNILSLIEDMDKENQIYFVVSYVYLVKTSQFYESANARDLEFVARRLGYSNLKLDWRLYNKDTKRRHREKLLEIQGLKPFDSGINGDPVKEVNRLLDIAETPRRIFFIMLEFLELNSIVRPRYSDLERMISLAYENRNKRLEQIVRREITQEGKEALEKLVEKNESKDAGKTKYKLTYAKKISHDTNLTNIRKNVSNFNELLEIYKTVEPIFKKLKLSRNSISAYSTIVRFNDVFRLKRTSEEKRYLYLTVFVAHQLYRLQDILILTLMAVLKSEYNAAENLARKEYFKNKLKHDEIIDEIIESNDTIYTVVKKAKTMLSDTSISYEERVGKALQILSRDKNLIDQVRGNASSLTKFKEMSAITIFIDNLEARSLSIKNKIRPIILSLTFDFDSSEKDISDAIKQYRLDKGKVNDSYPISIFPKKYQKHLVYKIDDPESNAEEEDEIKNKSGFRKNLYSVFFFNEISKSIASGALSFYNSYDYLSLDNLQIPLEYYQNNRDEILDQCNMSQYSCFRSVMKHYSDELDRSYKTVNNRIIGNINTFVSVNKDGTLKVANERNLAKATNKLNIKEKLYPEENAIPLCEVIATVNKACGFLDELTHSSVTGIEDKENSRELIAGIMGQGFHFGARKFSKLTDEVSTKILVRVIENYFSKQTLMNANDAIIRYMDQLPVAELFQNGQTSSDALKYSVNRPTLHANNSFKYGGNKKVIAPNLFVDSRNATFFSNIPDGAKKEAHYMLDGVLNNDVVESKMHSTDTHGYTNAVCAIAEIAGVNFAPRIAQFQKSIRIAFKTEGQYKKLGYQVLPHRVVNEEVLEKHWEQILRLVASLIMGYTTSEQLFKRLNSYSKHNPLYDALVEFGLIPKTLHLLRFMDDSEYRDNIQIQLNKGESLNALDRALAIGSAEYDEFDRVDQTITEKCKRLLKNCIVCWNYIYLSQKLINANNEVERKRLITRILESSTASWIHIRIQGKFILTDDQLSDSIGFDLEKIKDPKIVQMG